MNARPLLLVLNVRTVVLVWVKTKGWLSVPFKARAKEQNDRSDDTQQT